MIAFFIKRPIAVLVSFMGILTAGIYCSFQLPVSLLPNINIPEITIQINRKNTTAREIENTVVTPLRNELLQISHLKDIESQCRNEAATIKLSFEYGTNINYAYLETNEKIDALMRFLPHNLVRPKVIKANASDIPIVNLNVMLKKNSNKDFLELSEFCESVLKRRIEQLEEVAMVDITGFQKAQVLIVPNRNLMQSLNISEDILVETLQKNNIDLGNILIKDGQFQYNVRFSSVLKSKEDIEQLYINANGRLIQLKDISSVNIVPEKAKGVYLYNSQPAIAMAIIKQSDSRISDLKLKLNDLLVDFKNTYPDLNFQFSQDQTELLTISISNLQSDLIYGGIFAFIIMLIFFKNFKYPLIIGISIPSALIVSMLFFYFLDITINIISLAGLVMGMGMIIDNSIIVIDNITQHRALGSKIKDACVKGTSEVIRPMLSGVLTNCAVFFPLIFIGGITGALFYDQAIAIGVGLVSSFLVAIVVIPVLYNLLCENQIQYTNQEQKSKLEHILEIAYEKGLKIVFKHKRKTLLLVPMLLLCITWLIANSIDKKGMPDIKQTEVVFHIDWNEPINGEQNVQRTCIIVEKLKQYFTISNIYAGQKQFILNNGLEQNFSETQIYFKCSSNDSLKILESLFVENIKQSYEKAIVEKENTKTVFEQLFNTNEAMLVAHIRSSVGSETPNIAKTASYIDKLNRHNIPAEMPALADNITISVLHEKLLLYDIQIEKVYQSLKTAFNENNVSVLKDDHKYLPIIIGAKPELFNDLMNKLIITNEQGQPIPIRTLINISKNKEYKTIVADKQGENIPIYFNKNYKASKEIQKKIDNTVKTEAGLQLNYSGGMFANRKLFNNLGIVLCISLLLLYFILAAQFESLTQPLIVLLEIPLDIAGSLILLYFFKDSLNIMSAIGIIVMSGIVINDSILKIDAINQIKSGNVPLMDAILQGGHRRLKSIVMTTITTLLGFSTVLITGGLGSELQKPLALALIGGLIVGTLISLFYIPVVYWWIYRKKVK